MVTGDSGKPITFVDKPDSVSADAVRVQVLSPYQLYNEARRTVLYGDTFYLSAVQGSVAYDKRAAEFLVHNENIKPSNDIIAPVPLQLLGSSGKRVGDGLLCGQTDHFLIAPSVNTGVTTTYFGRKADVHLSPRGDKVCGGPKIITLAASHPTPHPVSPKTHSWLARPTLLRAPARATSAATLTRRLAP